MEFQKITHFLNITSDNKDLPKFEFKLINQNETTMLIKKLELKC